MMPGLTPGFGGNLVGPDGNPVYGNGPQSSASEPLSPAQAVMPQGMQPNMPSGTGIIGSIGNTPMTDSTSALQELMQQQISQNNMSIQMLSQMNESMRRNTKEMEKDFAAMRRHASQIATLQTSTIDDALGRIAKELLPAAQAQAAGARKGGGGNHPTDEGHARHRAAQDQDEASDAHPVDAPEGAGGGVRGRRRFRTMPEGSSPARGQGRHEIPEKTGRHAAPEPPGDKPSGGRVDPEHFMARSKEKSLTDDLEGMGMRAQGMTRVRFNAGRASFSIPGVLRTMAAHGANTLGNYEQRRFNYETDDEGKITKVLSAKTGEESGPVARRLQTGVGYAGRSLAHVAEGGEITDLLGAAGGPLGWAVGAGAFGVHELESQRQKNLFYQQITGGSNSSAFGQRAREGAFAYSNMLTMPPGMARQLYEGVSEVAPGTTNESSSLRSGALDFAMKQYKQLGLDVSDSLELIHTSIQRGVQDFGDLDASLGNVSKTAKAAGENSQEAIQKFSATYSQLLGNVTASGPTASQISEGVTNLGVELGKPLNMGSQDFTGLLSGQGLYVAAAAAGVDPMQAQTALAAGGTGATKMAGTLSNAGYQAFFTNVMGGAQAASAGQQYAKTTLKVSDVQGAGPDTQRQVGQYLIDNHITPSLAALLSAAQTLIPNNNFTDATMLQLVGHLALTGGDIGATEALQKASENGQISDPTKLPGGQNIMTSPQLAASDKKTGQGGDSQSANQNNARYRQDTALSKAIGHASGTAAQSYIQMVDDTGKRSAIAEALLKNQKSYSGKQFTVQTKDGDRNVDYTTLFTHYKDQLKAGTVVDADTGDPLSSASELDVQGDKGTKVTSSGRKAPKGADDVTKADGSVIIKPSAALQKWFDFTTTGGVTVDQSKRNGVPAAPFMSSPDQYPSATGQ
jgi:hypothetical protein